MTDTTLAFLSGLGGALLGAAGPVVITWLQIASARRMAIQKLSTDAAMHEFGQMHKAALIGLEQYGIWPSIPPLTSFLFYHARAAKLIEGDTLNLDNLTKLDADFEVISTFFEQNARQPATPK